MIISFNEEDNIARTLESLGNEVSVLLIDSFSDDKTLAIATLFKNVRVLQRQFDSFAGQCNFGLEHVDSLWVLSIDADYILPRGWTKVIESLPDEPFVGYSAMFDYYIAGKPVRGSILPPRTVLYKKEGAEYRNDGHGHRVQVGSSIAVLPFKIAHDDRKPLIRWLQSQVTYARQEANKIQSTPSIELGWNDRVRKAVVFAPALVFLLVFFFRGGFMSGWRGLYYAVQRFTAELMLSLFLIDRKVTDLISREE